MSWCPQPDVTIETFCHVSSFLCAIETTINFDVISVAHWRQTLVTQRHKRSIGAAQVLTGWIMMDGWGARQTCCPVHFFLLPLLFPFLFLFLVSLLLIILLFLLLFLLFLILPPLLRHPLTCLFLSPPPPSPAFSYSFSSSSYLSFSISSSSSSSSSSCQVYQSQVGAYG